MKTRWGGFILMFSVINWTDPVIIFTGVSILQKEQRVEEKKNISVSTSSLSRLIAVLPPHMFHFLFLLPASPSFLPHTVL